jgi:Fe-Mn family superoxide dismutase
MQLSYNYSDLEPFIDALTVETHYSKHHQGYVNKLNDALAGKDEYLNMDIVDFASSIKNLPAQLQIPAVINNAGQVYNHNLYWETLAPANNSQPSSELLNAINSTFGSFDDFKKLFSEAAATQFGSGWAWLSVSSNGNLEIDKTSNADSPIINGKKPIMTCDVWEHAYYLKYKNLRPDYIQNFWNLVNWEEVSRKFAMFK